MIERQSYLVPISLTDAEAARWIMLAESFGFDGKLLDGHLVKGSPAYQRKAIAFGVQAFMREAAGGMTVADQLHGIQEAP